MESGRFAASSGRWRRREPLAGDVSYRRYARLEERTGAGTAILVEYDDESTAMIRRDLDVLRWCHRQGLRVPEIVDSDPARGWVVLEDFGDEDADRALRATPAPRRPDLLARTVQPLAVLAAIPTARLPRWNRPLDAARLRFELAGFELWYLRHLRGVPPPSAVSAWLDDLAAKVAGHPTRVCHRDYHLNNLFFLADGAVGVIDVQDILVGPDTYDAASLLEERATPDLIAASDGRQWLEGWARAVGAAAGWRDRYLEVRLQRALKVLGTFARLVVAGRSGYQPWLDSVRRRLASAAAELDLPPRLTSLLVD